MLSFLKWLELTDEFIPLLAYFKQDPVRTGVEPVAIAPLLGWVSSLLLLDSSY